MPVPGAFSGRRVSVLANSFRNNGLGKIEFSGLRHIVVATALLLVTGISAAGQASAAQGDQQSGAQAQSSANATGNTQSSSIGQAATPLLPNSPLQPLPSRGLVRIFPFGNNPRPAAPLAAPFHLTYWGGPVISNVHVVAVFWGNNVNTAITANGGIDQFFTDITNSRFYDLLTEYSTVGVTGTGGATTNQTLGRGAFDVKATITPSICNVTPPTTCTVTDAQIQSELAAQITAGHLPAPVNDGLGIANSFYMIYFPPGVTIKLGTTDTSCVTFCAYHGDTDVTLTPKLIPYGVLPDFAPPSGCANGCGPLSATLLQRVTMVTSHELSEAVTDAQVGTAPGIGPPLAWYDFDIPTKTDNGEIGDICNQNVATVTAGANSYLIQTEFSNVQNACVAAPPVFQVTAPSQTGQGVSNNVTLTVQSSLTAATLPGYLGTVHFSSTDSSAVLPADYMFTAGDAGAHVFPVTLNTTGSQTLSITDVHSAGFSGSAAINVTTAGIGVTPLIATATVSAGQPATFKFNVTEGSPGTINLGCTGLPALTSCTFNPTSVTVTNTTVTMTVTTTATTTSSVFGGYRGPTGSGPLPWLALLSVAACMAMAFILSRQERLKRLRPVWGLPGLLLLVALAGCGGGSKTPTSTTAAVVHPGTPAGTYLLNATLTGSSGSVSQSLTLTVQ